MEWHKEYSGKSDEFFDFSHIKYSPRCRPDGKLKSSNLLLNSFDATGCSDQFYNLVYSIRSGVGEGGVVWGVKNIDGKIAWELYFYNYGDMPKNSIKNIASVVGPFFSLPDISSLNPAYFMFSVDVNDSLLSGRKADSISLYIDNRGTYAGYYTNNVFSYVLSGGGARLNNYYIPLCGAELKKALPKITCSLFAGESMEAKNVLVPELLNACSAIVLAKKSRCDSVYYVGVGVGELISFLRRFCYPSGIVSFVEKNAGKLDHMKYDVGFDYRQEDGKFNVLKSVYYGT